MTGKVPPETLSAQVFDRTGAPDAALRQGPAYGEDAAAIDTPAGTLIVSSDPISLAASNVGTLGVHVACNDVGVSGADPAWLTAVVLVPRAEQLDEVMADIDAAASDLGVTVVGGHTEVQAQLDRPLVSLTAFGFGEFVSSGGATPGDRIILTKGAGIEGTAILAADFGAELDVDAVVIERAETFLEEISVLPDSRQLREYASAMHDPTEGGVLAGLQELAAASEVRIEIERETIPIREETAILTSAAGVDPLRIFASGSVIATVPEDTLDPALAALEGADIDAAVIGTVEADGTGVTVDDELLTEPIMDDLYELWD